MRNLTFLLLLTAFALGACSKDPSPQEQLEIDIELIQEYLDDNGLTAQSTSSGLHYIIDVPGSGGHPAINDEVSVLYKGYFLDGDIFDQRLNSPISFPLSGVIQGWQEGIPLFQKGGKGMLLVPSGLGYGPVARPGVPANSVLIFEVELVDF
jgi:FKBP-type peptidyl-prolyl cis-trans isomerase FkpA